MRTPNATSRRTVTSARGGAAAVVVALVALFAIFVGLAAWKGTPVDKVRLHFSDGPLEGAKFQGIVEPGSGRRVLGVMDKMVLLPVTQRDYTASSDPGADGPPIVAPARGGVEIRFDVAAYFTLNTGDAIVPEFYRRVCVKFSCDTDKGWDEMLAVNFRRPIEQAIQQQVRQFTVDQLYAGVNDVATPIEDQGDEAIAILEQVQEAIAADLKENINRVLGGAYFCGPTFNRADPGSCPDFEFQITAAVPISDDVRAAYAQNAASAQSVIDAQNRARAQVEEANGQREAQEALQGLYSDPAYIAYMNALALRDCAKNNNCTLVVSSGGTGLNVNTGPAPSR